MTQTPLISCLMVALPSTRRIAGLRRSVADYLRQTWSMRELVIVLNGGDASVAAEIQAYVSRLGRDDIRTVQPTGDLPLGVLRNLAREEARGEMVCQWDDDDLYHPERLRWQAEALIATDGEALCLAQVMQFFSTERLLYCDNFGQTEETCFPGSILAWAKAPMVYPETGRHARLGEDSAVVLQLKDRGGLRTMADVPHLYVYVSHGANSWGVERHREVARWHGLSQGLLRRRERQLRAGLAPFDFGPGPVTMQGTNGPAFQIGVAPRPDA